MVVGITGNIKKSMVRDVVPGLVEWCRQRGVPFALTSDLADTLRLSGENLRVVEKEALGRSCDLVLAFGGDGTILSTARSVGRFGIPILGVNLGGLGFLAEVVIEELYPCLEDILNNNYDVIERMVLEAQVLDRSGEDRFYSLNDIVVDKGGFSRVVRIETYIDNTFLNTYVADGLIIATPTGSTAYSLSAGGPIVVPTMRAMIVTPICPHSLGARPVVIPENSVVKIVARSEHQTLSLSADGQVGCHLKSDEAVEIRKADYQVKWVASRRKSFYEVLSKKLNWGEDLRKE